MLTTSEWQGPTREGQSEGNQTQSCELMNKNHIRGVGWRRVSQDDEAMWSNGHRKCASSAEKVHVLIWGDLLTERSVENQWGYWSTKPWYTGFIGPCSRQSSSCLWHYQ